MPEVEKIFNDMKDKLAAIQVRNMEVNETL